MTDTALATRIETRIFFVRDQKVMVDHDLAALYQVPTKVLNQAVKRHANRFPQDFMFQLTADEVASLGSQLVTLERGRGRHRKYRPHAFTEQGVAMLSSVLNSERAVHVNIAIMRTFVRMREMAISHKDLARKLSDLEKKYDRQFRVVFEAIRRLMGPPAPRHPRIGFHGKGTP